MKSISVIGLGYIGLPTAVVMARAGMRVYGYDIDAAKVAAIKRADPVMEEPDVARLLHEVLQAGTLSVSTQLQAADCYLIAVPTPFKGGKRADLSHVWHVAHALGPLLKKGDLILVESTVPVDTTQQVARYLAQISGLTCGADFYVAYCPERVLPGNIIKELQHNDRIIGGVTPACALKARQLYESFVQGVLYITNATTAEMVKLVENSSRDVALAFAHQVASMCYEVGLNPYEVITLANKHPRVNILTPTCGVGGHCIAVDPWFLIERFPTSSFLLQAARRVNDSKPEEVIERIRASVRAWRTLHQRPCTVALLGLTYKPNVSDVRESPALHIAQRLVADDQMKVLIVDPQVSAVAGIPAHAFITLPQALEQADILVGLVGHAAFKGIERLLRPEQRFIDCAGIVPVAQQGHEHTHFWPANVVEGTELWESAAMTYTSLPDVIKGS